MVSQLPETGEVVPLGPSLNDAPRFDAIDRQVCCIQRASSWREVSHRSSLRAVEAMAHGHLRTFRNHVLNRLECIRERNVLLFQKTNQIIDAGNGRLPGGDAVSPEIRCDKLAQRGPVSGVDCINEGLDGVLDEIVPLGYAKFSV